MFRFYSHLGFQNPFYIHKNGKILLSHNLSELLPQLEHKTLDYTAVVETFSLGYALGNRTIIQGLGKTPWMGRLNKEKTDWEYFDVPKHKELDFSLELIAKELYQRLKSEMLSYLTSGEYSNIGLLLTGGMDSRIVAVVLNSLLKNELLSDKRVICYTWGATDSRDVEYAKRISNLFGWEWQQLTVDVEQMRLNYKLTIENGCEYTPIHLHAMSKIIEKNQVDCVFAGSFGDSVGRAEYSGVNVRNIKGIESRISNIAGILRPDYLKLSSCDIAKDLIGYHKLFPEIKPYQQFEQDLEIHYMRRMLNACMSVIDKRIPLFQMFTSPSVFGYMWSLRPELRTDMIYKAILELFAPELKNIPWARTGLPYPNKEGIPDEFKKKHHDYGSMIRKEFLASIKIVIEDEKDIAKELFNYKALMKLIKNIEQFPILGSHTYEEKLFWIAALLEFINSNNIKVDLPKNSGGYIEFVKNNYLYKAKFYLKKYR